jgi:phosphoribosylformylglycinamidine cyclo-ligase
MIDPQRVTAGDVVIALPSNGVHSNGFSLVRKVFDVENIDLTMTAAEYIRFCGLDEGCVGLSGRKLKETCALLNEETIGSILLAPTRIYVQSVLALMEKVDIKGIAHITGGGFYENIPRAIPTGFTPASAEVTCVSIRYLTSLLQKQRSQKKRCSRHLIWVSG